MPTDRFYFKAIIIILLLGMMILINGCGGGKPQSVSGGTVSGKVVFGVQPASLHSTNTYPVIPLYHPVKNYKSVVVSFEKIIRFRPGLGESEITKIVTGMGGRLKYKIYGTANSYVVDMVLTNSSFKTSNYSSNIESITENITLHASQIPNDPLYNYQWGCRMMYFPEAWDIQKGAPPVIIAVLDTGIWLTHTDLNPNLIIPNDQCNFVADPNSPLAINPTDDNGHGTHVTGIINAVSNNGEGVAGMAWNVKILPVKVLDQYGEGTYAQVIAGINYAVDKGAKVINISLGGTIYPVPADFIDAINNATAHNVTIVAAAGNENGPVDFPANYPGIIAVAALGPDGQRAPYSNYGPEIAICAPGGAGNPVTNIYTQTIVSTYNDSDTSYAYMSGTSMATPHISGLVALLYSQNPEITPAQVRDKLQSFAIDKGTFGFDNYYGYGMPDAYAVLSGKATRFSEIAVYVVSTGKSIQMSKYPDGLGNYTFSGITTGNKHICAHLDKNRNGQVDTGDLFGYQSVTIQNGINISNVNIILSDDQITPAPSLADFLQTVLPQ